MILTIDYLKTILDYNPLTGDFTWKQKLSSTGPAGSKAGCIKSTDGYVQIQINKRKYRAHRLAWFYLKGKWPKKYIDHINHNRSDNRIENLRECTDSTNQANRRISRNNTSGYKGVYWSRRKQQWEARIKKDGKSYNLGHYDNKEGAYKAYCKAAKNLFGSYAYTGLEYATEKVADHIR
jgi:hypothetical protein